MPRYNTDSPESMKAEISEAFAELNAMTRKQKEQEPLTVAWWEFVIHANQRALSRLPAQSMAA